MAVSAASSPMMTEAPPAAESTPEIPRTDVEDDTDVIWCCYNYMVDPAMQWPVEEAWTYIHEDTQDKAQVVVCLQLYLLPPSRQRAAAAHDLYAANTSSATPGSSPLALASAKRWRIHTRELPFTLIPLEVL